MKKLLPICILACISLACKKKDYQPYLGTYNCTVEEHLDSTGYNFDTTYTATESLTEINSKEKLFRDLTIPYKYIDDNGFYEASQLVPGLAWGRQITLDGDSLHYYHHEVSNNAFWYIRYTGTLSN